MDTKEAGKKGGLKTKSTHPKDYYKDIRSMRTTYTKRKVEKITKSTKKDE